MTAPELTQRESFVETFTAIELDPQSWNQKAWAIRSQCGTAYCFAGWTCVLAGREIDWDNELWAVRRLGDGALVATTLAEHDEPAIHEAAAELLGLNDDQADDLFGMDNDLLALYVKAARILGCSWTSLAAEVEGRVFEAQRESAALIREATAIPVVVA